MAKNDKPVNKATFLRVTNGNRYVRVFYDNDYRDFLHHLAEAMEAVKVNKPYHRTKHAGGVHLNYSYPARTSRWSMWAGKNVVWVHLDAPSVRGPHPSPYYTGRAYEQEFRVYNDRGAFVTQAEFYYHILPTGRGFHQLGELATPPAGQFSTPDATSNRRLDFG